MDRAILDLFHEYRHNPMARREFLDRLAKLAGGTAAAAALLPLLEGSEAQAAVVPPDDPKLESTTVQYPGPAGAVTAYQSRPREKGAGRLPAVVVIHENRGLNDHIRDVARRAALAGYHALAPDLLSRKGGTPPVQDQAIAAIRALPREDAAADLRAAVAFLQKSPQVVADKVGAVGFCWGGGMVNLLATLEPGLRAAVAFYGAVAPAGAVPGIQAPLLLIYAGNDRRINERVPAYLDALDKARKRYTVEMFPGVEHAFHNDTSPARYNQAAAREAWETTLNFFRRHLGG